MRKRVTVIAVTENIKLQFVKDSDIETVVQDNREINK